MLYTRLHQFTSDYTAKLIISTHCVRNEWPAGDCYHWCCQGIMAGDVDHGCDLAGRHLHILVTMADSCSAMV